MINLKKSLREGKSLIGAIVELVGMDRMQLERSLEKSSKPYDFLMADSQHSPFTEPDLIALCQTADELSMPVVFRIMDTKQIYLIGKYLDLGAVGIEVPQVNTPQTAAEAVEKFYYPPLGIRSIGGNYRAPLGFEDKNEHFAYTDLWNQTGLLMVQVETVRAVMGSQTLARPGIDCLSFGPVDLMHDVHFNPHPQLTTLDDCVRHVVKELEDTNTVVCFRHGKPENRQKYLDLGARILLERPPA